jgi:hypothetical protein
MASRGEELLISADSHIVEDPHFWESRLPTALKDQAPLFPERANHASATSGRSGSLACRLSFRI